MEHKDLKKRYSKIDSHRGAVILIVLLAIVLLSFSAYVFAELMLVESVVSSTFAQETQARSAAESGVEYVAAILNDRRSSGHVDLYNNPELFQNVPISGVLNSHQPPGQPTFCVVAPFQGNSPQLRFGLVDESKRFNLNCLPLHKRQSILARKRLLSIDKMTPQIADAILDWLDEDDEPREFGAEQSYYQSLNPPVNCRNSRIDLLSDLLQVRGVTAELLYGEDTNHDGWLDATENDGAETFPVDNSDGVLSQGWSAELTTFGGKSNYGPDGFQKIDLNQPSLAKLYDELAAEFDENIARFVIAYRMEGPIDSEDFPDEYADSDYGNSDYGNSDYGNDEFGNDEFGNDDYELADAQRRTAEQTNESADDIRALFNLANQNRGGIDLTIEPSYRVRSLYDLFGSAVRLLIDNKDTILDSPWSADPSTIASRIPLLDQKLDTDNGNDLAPFVNVNQSSLDVLMTVPGMDREVAKMIIAARPISGTAIPESRRSSTAWLLTEGIINLQQLRRIAPYITVRGDVFRVDVVGFAGGANSPVSRVSAILDATYQPVRIIHFRDLPVLSSNSRRFFTYREE